MTPTRCFRPVLSHQRGTVTGKQQRRADVDRQQRVEPGDVERVARSVRAQPGVVDEDVQAPGRRDGGSQQDKRRVRISEVAVQHDRVAGQLGGERVEGSSVTGG